MTHPLKTETDGHKTVSHPNVSWAPLVTIVGWLCAGFLFSSTLSRSGSAITIIVIVAASLNVTLGILLLIRFEVQRAMRRNQ